MSNPTKEEIESRVRTILAEQLGLSEHEIKPTSTLSDLGSDSLDDVEIVMALEDDFDITLEDSEIEQAIPTHEHATLEKLCELVSSKLT